MKEKAFVIFGSLSDSATFSQVIEALKEKKIPFAFHGLSAHKTPNELHTKIKKTKAEIFITGAGLSSALPGVVASQTIKPVIGVCTPKDFDGLDSLLSTMQMPPNIPVLAVGPKKPKDAAKHVENFLNGINGITLVERSETKEHSLKAQALLKEFDANFRTTQSIGYNDQKTVFIDFVPLEKLGELEDADATAIIVAVKKDSRAQDAVALVELMQNHLFVGLNRAENAVLGAMQLVGKGKTYKKQLTAFRKKISKKVLDDNKKEFKKWNQQ